MHQSRVRSDLALSKFLLTNPLEENRFQCKSLSEYNIKKKFRLQLANWDRNIICTHKKININNHRKTHNTHLFI